MPLGHASHLRISVPLLQDSLTRPSLVLSDHLPCHGAQPRCGKKNFLNTSWPQEVHNSPGIDYAHLILSGGQPSLCSYVIGSCERGLYLPLLLRHQSDWLLTDEWLEHVANSASGQNAREKHKKCKSKKLYANISMSSHLSMASLDKHVVLNSRQWVYSNMMSNGTKLKI